MKTHLIFLTQPIIKITNYMMKWMRARGVQFMRLWRHAGVGGVGGFQAGNVSIHYVLSSVLGLKVHHFSSSLQPSCEVCYLAIYRWGNKFKGGIVYEHKLENAVCTHIIGDQFEVNDSK